MTKNQALSLTMDELGVSGVNEKDYQTLLKASATHGVFAKKVAKYHSDRDEVVDPKFNSRVAKAVFLISTEDSYSINCPFFETVYPTLDELIKGVVESGQDPNYQVMKNGKGIGQDVWEFIVE